MRAPGPGVDGTVYLLHFDAPFGHARHYLGWTTNLAARNASHTRGNGSRLLAAAAAAGITWTVARTWPGTRVDERRLHNAGHTRRCPVCRPSLRLRGGAL